MKQSRYPSLYQINTRVWMTQLAQDLGRPATLDDIPDAELDRLAESGFEWIWFLSVWRTGELGRSVSLQHKVWKEEFKLTLPDLQDQDVGGSGFAIAEYHAHPNLGSDQALERLRERLHERGLKLMLDFVPNHMGPDHSWVKEHPEFFVSGTEKDLADHPKNYTRIKSSYGDKIVAYGRDPYFEGWADTLQLDYSNPDTVVAMDRELLRISSQCDGVRCDMAMLILPDVFKRTWGRKAQPFWPMVIKAIKERNPEFCFIAEVYWDMEWELQQQGFDYAYDKRLYDRLREGHAKPLREHFAAALDYQDKLARFMENHDEPRAAAAFEMEQHQAAAVITFFSTGLRFFHQGELEGRKKRISPHLVRAPHEPLDHHIQLFYSRLLTALKESVFRNGHWRMAECMPTWDGNSTWNNLLVFVWEEKDKRALVVVNYAPSASQCFVRLPFSDLGNQSVQFRDRMSTAIYERDGNELSAQGLFLDLPAWGYHIFEVNSSPRNFK